MLRDEAAKYVNDWPEKKRYNCAEATLRAANDYYHLNLDEDNLKMASAFGGGMFSGEACGIVTAGCAAIAKLHAANEAPYVNEELKESSKAWVEAVRDKYGAVSCRELKEGCDCKLLVQEASELFETLNPVPVKL